ncbi:MAG: heme-copper oxidase subunit III [Chloroflexi bacterium]|nr:heme-copper oxidase subunit III [Chloroflexota bacterium]MCZ6865983.1 heme-copper oxidase subunit III [Chloroflexota bacterium]
MWTFLGSECLFFGTLIANHMINRNQAELLNGVSPACVLDIPITSASTFVLLMSSVAMVLAVTASERGDMKQLRIWLFMTAVLGATFLGFQVYEFSAFVDEGLTIGTNLYGSTFFILTGFHGVHVTVGVIWILSMLAASYRRSDLVIGNPLNVDITGLYWHFVDVVWIVIFTVVYLVGAIGLNCTEVV